MDREKLLQALSLGPVRILMNDGRTYDIVHANEALITDIAAYVMYRADDGKLRAMILPLVTMSGVEDLSQAS